MRSSNTHGRIDARHSLNEDVSCCGIGLGGASVFRRKPGLFSRVDAGQIMTQARIAQALSVAGMLASSHVSALEPQFECAGYAPSQELTGVAGKSVQTEEPDKRVPGGHHHALVVFAKFRGEQHIHYP